MAKNTERAKAIANLKRRIARASKTGLVFDTTNLFSRRAKTLENLRGDKLIDFARGFQLPPRKDHKGIVTGEGDIVPVARYKEYRRVKTAAEKAQKKARNLGKWKEPPKVKKEKETAALYTPDKDQFEKLIEGYKKRGDVSYWTDRDIRMVDNYLNTLKVVQNQDIADLIRQQIADKGTAWARDKLLLALEGGTDLDPQFLFDSDQGVIYDNMWSVLNFWEVDPDEAETYMEDTDFDNL